jgi:hypothetical protein
MIAGREQEPQGWPTPDVCGRSTVRTAVFDDDAVIGVGHVSANVGVLTP